MEQRWLGDLFEVSALTLGGGGLAQIWGQTSRAEAVATVHAAHDAGINLFDVAPAYGDGEAERVLGEAYAKGYPAGARVLTKCMLGQTPPGEVAQFIEGSLAASLERLRRDDVDLFLLHGPIVPDDRPLGGPTSVLLSTYLDKARDVLAGLARDGRVGAWGISALGPDDACCAAINGEPHPQVIECSVNALFSEQPFAPQEERPRVVIRAAAARRIGVLGVRAVQRGALTDALDREVEPGARVAQDYARAVGFRALAKRLGFTAAYLAHRYALSIPDVATIVLGVKNRDELAECVTACSDGPLERALVEEVELSMAPPT